LIREMEPGAPPATSSPEELPTTTSPRAATASPEPPGILPLKNVNAQIQLISFLIMSAPSVLLSGRE
jgi:hypothetical protein